MNPRQRRAVVVFVLSALCLLAAFAIIVRYVADVREEVDPKVRVVALGDDVRAHDPIDANLRLVEMPERWVPDTALRDRSALAGLVAAADYPAGSIVQQGMAQSPPELAPGQREIAILVDAETGVAGKVSPGATVDIVATFAPDEQQRPARSRVLVPGARVLEIGEPREQPDGEDGAVDPTAVVPVTFALNVRQSLALTYAESFAEEVRLALVRPGEQSEIPLGEREYRAP